MKNSTYDIAEIPRRTSCEPAPLSFGQELLWMVERATPGTAAWNVARPFRLRGMLNEAALQAALDSLIERHEALRTIFADQGSGPRQIVLAPHTVPIKRLSLESLPLQERLAAANEIVNREKNCAFDLTVDEPFRVSLMCLTPDDHVLCILTHHIVSDGWSKNLMFRDLSTYYEAFLHGETAVLPVLPIQFSDYAAWERGEDRQQALQEQREFWRAQLDDAPDAVDLPTDYPRPQVHNFAADRAVCTLPSTLIDQATAFARERHSTLYIALMTAYMTLLYRYSGQNDILVGSPSVGRTQSETEELIGFFANTLMLRQRIEDDPTFAELFDAVRDTFFEAYERQDVPLEQLILEMQKDRQLKAAPLFNVLLTMEDVLSDELTLSGLLIEPLECESRGTKFDCTLLATRQADGMRLTLWYRTDLFTAATGQRFLTHFERILAHGVRQPSERISSLALLTDEERQTVLEVSQGPALGALRSVLVDFYHIVATMPQRTALEYEGFCLRYDELGRRVRAVASALRSRGIGTGTLVGLGLDRSADAIVAMLGILASGAAYVPLPPDMPTARIEAQIAQCALAHVITHGSFADRYSSADHVMLLSDLSEEDDVSPQTPTGAPDLPGLHDIAYMIFTSGSTGTPKGVVVSHGNLAHYVAGLAQRLQCRVDEQLSYATVSSLGADLGNTTIFAALAFGGTLHIVSKQVATDAQGFALWAAQRGIDVLKITPTHLSALLGDGEPRVLPKRWLIFGGELCSWELVRRVRAVARCRMVNHYGPSETTVGAATYLITGDFDERRFSRSVPIGIPLPGVACYVLDQQRALVPDGIWGELYIGGGAVAQGYLNRPDLTAERFLADPFVSDPAARMYRTGDKVKRLPGGELEFFGRYDRQLKIRGFRVELGEIEHALVAHADIADAVVVAKINHDHDVKTHAYAVLRPGSGKTAQDFLLWLGEKLPEHLIPTTMTLLTTLPLRPNGKVDHDALPEPADALVEAYIPPVTVAEVTIEAIWREALQVERISMDADFFALGFHSILAIRALDTLGRTFGIRIPIRKFFEARTIARLAKVVDEEIERVARKKAQELEKQLAFLEALSDDDVEQLLNQEAEGA